MKHLEQPLLWLTVLLAGCSETVGLSPAECGQPCYTGPTITHQIGTCADGRILCAGNEEPICFGDVLPTAETCGSGLDTDCSGAVGDGDPKNGESCGPEHIGECRPGYWGCVDDRFTCLHAVYPQMELCGDKDYDCDGIVGNPTPTQVCYSGDPQQIAYEHSRCHAGVLICVEGVERCENEVLPTIEICNNIDDDCNGIIDDVPEPQPYVGPIDLTFILDLSGSMHEEWLYVQPAILEFLYNYRSSDDLHVAVILSPGLGYSVDVLYLALTPVQDALDPIAMIRITNGGLEPSYDAFMHSVDGTFDMKRRPDAANVTIYFGDEDGQTNEGNTETTVAAGMYEARAVVYLFLPLEFAGVVQTYDAIAHDTGGAIFDVKTSTSTDFVVRFQEVVEKSCL